mmetsp:Transcript_64316/g.88968  ORF Transcript_64316/g.88968 Transcript_64316/m.88968 type:complete len:243 (+) Transcript_64316:341-1069(+)
MGSTKRACASATRMRQPPDMSWVNLFIIGTVKPRPCSSSHARGSKVLGSILSSLSPMTWRRSAFFSGSSSQSFMLSSSRRACSLATTSTTAWMAVTASGLASWSRNHMSMWSGIGTSRAAMAASIVDLPEPFWPMSPIRRPKVSSSLVSLMNSLPYTLMENCSILTSTDAGCEASTPVITAVSRTSARLDPPLSSSSFFILSITSSTPFLLAALALALAALFLSSSLRPIAYTVEGARKKAG